MIIRDSDKKSVRFVLKAPNKKYKNRNIFETIFLCLCFYYMLTPFGLRSQPTPSLTRPRMPLGTSFAARGAS